MNVLELLFGRAQKDSAACHWIRHPHVLRSDEYECSGCHSRFRTATPSCPRCGRRMTGKTVTDDREWLDEQSELDTVLDDD